MKDAIFFLILGVGTGSLFALLGTSLVITFKGTGIINFGQCAIAMYATYQYVQMKTDGSVRLPWIWLPTKIQFVHGAAGAPTAIAAALVTGVLLGAMAHYLVFRPLRRATSLAKVVASVGVLLYLNAVASLNFGTQTRTLTSFLPQSLLSNFLGLGRPFSGQIVWTVAISAAVVLIIWAFYRYARYGMAIRGAADDEMAATVLGYSATRLALVSWTLSGVVGALAGVVAGPVAGSVDPARYTALLVPALGAALLGGLRSIPITWVGGMALGAAASFVVYLSGQGILPQWAVNGASDAIPMLAIGAVLILRGNRIPIRGTLAGQSLPRSPHPVRLTPWTISVAAVALLLGAAVSGAWELALTTSIISVILVLSYVLLTGYSGQVSLAQIAFSGVGAIVMLRLMSNGHSESSGAAALHGPGLPMIVALPIALIVSAIVGVIVGLPAVRVRGVQLAVVTLAAGLTIQDLVFSNESVSGLSGTTSAYVPAPNLFGLNLSVQGRNGLPDRWMFTLFAVVVAALAAIWVANIRRSGTGRRLLAVRANERAAAAVGINVSRTKLAAFAGSSVLAALAGCMFAFQQQSVSSANWDIFAGLSLLAFAFMAGLTSVAGGIIGGVIAPAGLFFYALSNGFSGISEYVPLIGGIGLILNTISVPEGISLAVQDRAASIAKVIRSRRHGERRAAAAANRVTAPDESRNSSEAIAP